jgi:hypothetical protein
LHGELNGQPFLPQQGELFGSVLSLREGQDFFASRELVIRLQQPVTGALRLDVLPGDQGPLPEIEVSWLLPEQELPEARRLSHGYTLHLNLQPLPPNKLAGDFHLVLPAQFKTTLSGRIEVFRDGLRYRDGKVDRHVDSSDTLAYVIEDYLQRRFATRAVQLADLPVVKLPAEVLDLTVEAQINGQSQRLPIRLNKGASRGWAVDADRFAPLPERAVVAPAPQVPVVPVETANKERISRPLDRRLRFSLEGLLRSPNRYENLTMRVSTTRGSSAEGRFQGVDQQGRLVIRQRMNGSGAASYALRPEDISTIELLEP